MRVAFIAHKTKDMHGDTWGGELIEFNTRDKRPPKPTPVELEIQRSAVAAEKLHTIGMPVIVTLDDGTEEQTKTRSLPWALGHGHFICHLESRQSYDCNRIRPL